MSNAMKRWFIAAALLTVVGLLLFLVVMVVLKFDFTKLSTVSYETTEQVITDAFRHISVSTDTADIVFLPSDTEQLKVVCYQPHKQKHTVEVRDDTLYIDLYDTRKWYECIGISFQSSCITVYLPEAEYGTLGIKESTGDIEISNELRFADVDVKTSTGDVTCRASAKGAVKIHTSTGEISVENSSVGALDLSVSTGGVTVSNVTCAGEASITVTTGRVTVTGVTCNGLLSSGSTGDISLNNVVAAGQLSIERSTGDVRFDNSDAANIIVHTNTGHVTGSLRSSKVFFVQSDTGRVNVPKTIVGGPCEITTDTGNVILNVLS